MRILYLGAASGTSGHRLAAMRRIGHEVFQVDPDLFVPQTRFAQRLNYEFGGLFWERAVAKQVLAGVEDRSFDCTWVDGGKNVGSRLIRSLRDRFGPLVNHNVDNPFKNRDRGAWLQFRRSVSAYDLVAVVRRENVDDARRLGARRTLFHYRTADEVAHAPRTLTDQEKGRWSSEVAFVGTGLPREGRGRFIEEILNRGVPLTLVGGLWERLPEWPRIKSCWREPQTRSDADYSGAILGAKVCLCLLSKGNHDLHTTRSAEIPALGRVLCAPRTKDHLDLYREWEEAVFFDDAEECAESCHRLLADSELRERIARQGHEKCKELGLYNEPFCRTVLQELLEPSSTAT